MQSDSTELLTLNSFKVAAPLPSHNWYSETKVSSDMKIYCFLWYLMNNVGRVIKDICVVIYALFIMFAQKYTSAM
jgi:hypothetical protein